MRTFFRLITGALIATAAIAAPACVTESYASYLTLGAGGCSIGDATFSNFSTLSFTNSGGVPALPTSDIQVIPGGTTLDPTLTFEYITTPGGVVTPTPVTVNSSGQIFSFGFSYQMVLTAATLVNIQQDSTFANTSPGSVSSTKNISLLAGGPTLTSTVGDGGVSNSLGTRSGQVVAVTGAGPWLVSDTTSLQAQSGMATQSSFENLFSLAPSGTVPEPLTTTMIGSGLLLVGLGARRRARKA